MRTLGFRKRMGREMCVCSRTRHNDDHEMTLRMAHSKHKPQPDIQFFSDMTDDLDRNWRGISHSNVRLHKDGFCRFPFFSRCVLASLFSYVRSFFLFVPILAFCVRTLILVVGRHTGSSVCPSAHLFSHIERWRRVHLLYV